MNEYTIIAGIGVAGLSIFTSRLLEEYAWFQRVPPETKRLIAVSLAALIALTGHVVELVASGNISEPSAFTAAFLGALGVVTQQVFHALTKPRD